MTAKVRAALNGRFEIRPVKYRKAAFAALAANSKAIVDVRDEEAAQSSASKSQFMARNQIHMGANHARSAVDPKQRLRRCGVVNWRSGPCVDDKRGMSSPANR